MELGRALRRRGDSLTFIFPENDNILAEGSWANWLKREGFQTYLVKKPMADDAVLSFLNGIIKKHDIDILHLHFGMFHRAVVNHAKSLGVKILVHDHMDFSVGSNIIKQKVRGLVQSLVYRKNRVSVASVNPWKDSIYFFARHWYVPNGLSLARNVPHSASREECRRMLGVTSDEKVCLFLGWDVYRKGLDVAVKAINELRKRDPDVILGIVGIGEPPNLERLRFIADTGTDPGSSWIRYFPSCEDMFAYHKAVDAYLSASRSEAFSYGILEAISQNTPIAVSDIKGTSWCHRYSKAVVYSTEDVHACANAISQALSLGRGPSNGDEIVKEYSIEKWCERMVNIYMAL